MRIQNIGTNYQNRQNITSNKATQKSSFKARLGSYSACSVKLDFIQEKALRNYVEALEKFFMSIRTALRESGNQEKIIYKYGQKNEVPAGLRDSESIKNWQTIDDALNNGNLSGDYKLNFDGEGPKALDATQELLKRMEVENPEELVIHDPEEDKRTKELLKSILGKKK